MFILLALLSPSSHLSPLSLPSLSILGLSFGETVHKVMQTGTIVSQSPRIVHATRATTQAGLIIAAIVTSNPHHFSSASSYLRR